MELTDIKSILRFTKTNAFGKGLIFLSLFVQQTSAQIANVNIIENSAKLVRFEMTIPDSIIRQSIQKSTQNEFDQSGNFTTPAFLIPSDGDFQFQLTFNGKTFTGQAANAFLRIKEVGRWRGFRLGTLQTTAQALKNFKDGKIQAAISFSNLKKQTVPSENELKTLKHVINGQHAAYFRKEPTSTIQTTTLEHDEKIKIELRENGFYRITVAEILATGFDLDINLPAKLHLHNKGNEVPIYIKHVQSTSLSPLDEIWFYGQRLPGDSSWFNEETETNVYFLSQNTTDGLRYSLHNTIGTIDNPSASGFIQKIHFELDKEYNHGDTDLELYITDRVPGEGWYWRRFGPGNFIQNFELPELIETGDNCTLRVYFRGKTANSIKPNHHLVLKINGYEFADTLFSDNADIVLERDIPGTWFRNGSNTLGIELPGDTDVPNERIDLQWIEVEYPRAFNTALNRLQFEQPANSVDDSLQYQITGFEQDEIHIFNLTTQEKLTGYRIEQNGIAFRAAFRDTRADTAVYFAVTPYGFLSPDTLFRIKSNDLQSTQNTADLIIIAHAKFLTEAERLAAHRRSVSGLRVKVVDIADVYNQFNYGIFAAQAIKDFLNYAYSSWQYPAPQFALLLGDGCWDPRKIGGDAVQTTFIPVLGNPVSDSRLVCFDGPEDFLPDMFIGRLPVYTQEEASVIVDKIIQYDLEPIPTHIKKFAFLNGGINTDEQLQFRAQSEELINRYIDPAPVAGEPIRIYKDTDGRTEGEMQPEILQTFADGVSTFVFSGHAASSTWETMLQNEDIDKLQNIDKLPVVFSMTCHTGKFAEPRQVSFAEDFMRLPQRGAAAFWGTSGWGWITQDGWLLDGLFNSLAIDSVREIGALVTAAKLKLHTQHPQTDGRNVNVIDQYTLFGDPSMKLKLPLQPDLYVPPQVISTEPETLSELDSITVLIVKIENLGLATTDSVEINTDIFNSENSLIFSTRSRIAPIGLRDSLRIYWTGQNRRGPYKVQLVVNPLNSIGEVRFDNNSLSQEIYFYSSNLTIAEPAVLTQISETQPTLYVYNPEISQESSASYEFEIDTLSNFTSPFLIQSEKVNEQHVRTGWKVSSVLADGLYFWRCRRNTESIQSPWVNAYFWINSGSSDWSFRQEKQFWPQNGTTYGTQSSGILLPLDNSKTKTLQVRSLGFSDGNGYCDLIIDGQKINTNTDFRGHNLLSIDPVSQQITVGPLNFNTSSSNTASDSMAAVLRDLPDRSMLLIGIHGDGSEAITEAALQEFENFGSAFSGDVSLNDSWSLIGVKGATDKSKTEKRTANGLGPAVVSDTMLQFVQNGEFYSQPLGPALSWGVLHFVQDTFRLIPGPTEIANMHINIEGKLNSQVAWMKINEFSQSGEYDLSAIDVSQFPYLRLHAIFTDDDGLDSPVLRSWQLSYEPAGDIAIDPTSVNLSADSLLAGENIRLSADIYAFNAFTKDSVGIALSVVNDLGDYSTLNSKKIKIPYNNSTRVSFDFMLATQGSHRLKLDIDNLNEVAESHELNNTVNLTAFSRRDEEPPSIQIFVDSKTPLNNEYISATPLILYEIYDDSPAAIQDTSNFVLYLDNKRIYFNSPQPDMELLPKNEDKLRAQILFEPDLTPGNHILSIEVTDAFGYKNNLLQELKVAENFALYDVLNYPNPFSSETVFTFFLTQEAQSVQIKIFTVTGKLIQVLENYSPEIGYNQIPWDSRDHDFDLLANGIYLYKVIAKQNDKTVEFIGKAAIAR